jgi:hypothetical protein
MFVVAMSYAPALAAAQDPGVGQAVDDGQSTDQIDQQNRSATRQSTWKGAFVDSFRLLMMEHAGRILFQEKTRRELGGSFFGDYHRSIRWPGKWEDSDGWIVNYIGHPIHGAAAGRTWLHNDPSARGLELGLSRKYWASRAKAAQWSAFYSLQFEIGPVSEASIGNVGLDPDTTGWVDHVVTPVGALGIIVVEDALDKYLVQLVERHTANRVLRATVRIVLNPARALANLVEGRTPWFRDRGPLNCCR